mmetsp:Transcript_41356/g.50304  ORF Transcript_41356/g.50304 Transcript_41356/m.50304 type:complete len:217 (-) Transcript_41356:61-711(-)
MTVSDTPPPPSSHHPSPSSHATKNDDNIITPHPPVVKDDQSGFEIWATVEKKTLQKNDDDDDDEQRHQQRTTITTHTGGCHCGAIRFQCRAPTHLTLWDCNCSDCRMRRNVHVIIPQNDMTIIATTGTGTTAPPNNGTMTEYRWGSGRARHMFCAICGISPFYKPRSNPDGWAVTFACLDEGTVEGVEVRRFDGRHWEEFIAGDGRDIKGFSSTGD